MRLLLVQLILVTVPSVAAQDRDGPPSTVDDGALFSDGALPIFLDCRRCDDAYMRREITFVNYVRDRERAAVHVLVTDEATGGGGRQYTFDLIGQGNFEGQDFSVTYTARPTDTEDEQRMGIVRTLKVALVPYLMQTPLAARMSVSVDEDEGPVLTGVDDPWRGWMVEFYGDGYGNMEASQYSLDLRYGVFVDRVTEEWKIRFRPYFNYNVDGFERDGEKIRSASRRDGFDSYAIRSVDDHWSVGVFGDLFSSTFSNIDMRYRIRPAVEFSVFPYREASRRKLTFAYLMGGSQIQYDDTTIFGQTSEMLAEHAVDAEYEVIQPWGSIDVGLNAQQFVHDLTKYRIELDVGVSVRLARGFSIVVGGELELIHDQINLPRGGASLEEVLLRRRQLATNYEVSGSIGFRYRFGSVYDNVVNTRF